MLRMRMNFLIFFTFWLTVTNMMTFNKNINNVLPLF
jgi:hypothetical protein